MGGLAREGRIPFEGHSTWYREVGPRVPDASLPMLCLHGGPGATWWHMKPYEALAADARRVVWYDQLGCGRSTIEAPHDVEMFVPDLFVREIDAVRDALGLERLMLLGHSWGGMLAMAYAATRPPGLEGLVVQSSPASVPFWRTELARLRSALPPDVEATLRAHEDAGTTDADAYTQAVQVFYERHLCRVEHPDWLRECFLEMERSPEVYAQMNGPSEFHVIGTLREWDIEDRLGRIEAPTLLFCGRHDEVTPATMARIHDRIPGSELVVLEESSHMAQAEEPEATLDLIRGFVERVEGR